MVAEKRAVTNVAVRRKAVKGAVVIVKRCVKLRFFAALWLMASVVGEVFRVVHYDVEVEAHRKLCFA